MLLGLVYKIYQHHTLNLDQMSGKLADLKTQAHTRVPLVFHQAVAAPFDCSSSSFGYVM